MFIEVTERSPYAHSRTKHLIAISEIEDVIDAEGSWVQIKLRSRSTLIEVDESFDTIKNAMTRPNLGYR
jgi:hypothetical protein